MTAFTGAAAVLASSIAGLIQCLFVIARDYREMKKGNELLKNADSVDYRVFDTCPLLGCYYITCANDSQIMNFMPSDITSDPAFMSNMETMKKKYIVPLQIVAAQFIKKHRVELIGVGESGLMNVSAIQGKVQLVNKGIILRGDRMDQVIKRKMQMAKHHAIRTILRK